MRPENASDINRKYTAFFACFVGLLLFSLLCIYFLFRTHNDQVERMGAQQTALNMIQNRQLVLSDKMDKLLHNYRLVNSGEVENNAFLINEIGAGRDDMERTYLQSDTPAFPVYGRVLREMRTSLMIKDSISVLISKEAFLRASLNNCIASYRTAQQQVNHNSSRFR